MTDYDVGDESIVDVLVEHRAAAQLTRLDVDDLAVFAGIVAALHAAAVDHDLDRAAGRLGVLLSLLPPRHVLVVAARSGLEVGDLRRERRAEMVAASHAVAAAVDWRRWAADYVPYDELERQRSRITSPNLPAADPALVAAFERAAGLDNGGTAA